MIMVVDGICVYIKDKVWQEWQVHSRQLLRRKDLIVHPLLHAIAFISYRAVCLCGSRLLCALPDMHCLFHLLLLYQRV